MSILIQQAVPVKQSWILIESCTVLSTVNYPLSFLVNFIENALKDIFFYFYMAIYYAWPMQDHVCEVGAELLEINVASFSHVH